MALATSDRVLIEEELGRDISAEESLLFENLWSEHCAYRSSTPVLAALDSSGPDVLVGPGDDAAVVQLNDEYAIAIGIESHNHPSFVDPYDGAATGVGGIVRDILSMGAYPIALTDSLYFGPYERDHSKYLFEGVVEGIADYGNSIGVPTVGGSVNFLDGYIGNPLVNVGCIGVVPADRIVTAVAQQPGNYLVLVGNATGRDGLGGASFASEDLSGDAETEDRPAVQVGDPYTEKLLIEANEALLEAGVIESARDLGAAGLGGATVEMVAKGGLGARIKLDAVHLRESGMVAGEILLSESQERMCYEVKPENVDVVEDIAARFDLESSVVGELTDEAYVCTFDDEEVVRVPPALVADGAPIHDRETANTPEIKQSIPDVALEKAFNRILGSPDTVSREWVYRQYDHEVGVRTGQPPGADAAVIAVREADMGVAITAGAYPNWTAVDPRGGAKASVLANATDLAVTGAIPFAAVDCLNAGNPETPAVFGGFSAMTGGLSAMCEELEVPVVGGNVSLYNDSETGPIPPTPTVMMIGRSEKYTATGCELVGDRSIVLIGPTGGSLGGSEYLAQFDGSDVLPELPADVSSLIGSITEVAGWDSTSAIHDLSVGGLGVTLAEMTTQETGVTIEFSTDYSAPEVIFSEVPGRVVVETSDPDRVCDAFDDSHECREIGHSTTNGGLALTVNDASVIIGAEEIKAARSLFGETLE